MSNLLVIKVGVIVAWEQLNHPWQTERWRPIEILINPPDCNGWRELRRVQGCVHYHAANVELELHRKDAAAYQVNLVNGEPVVYVVLQERETEHAIPVEVQTVTVSPFDAQAHDFGSGEVVAGVRMPDPLRALVAAFVSEHHDDEPFVKRNREKADRAEPYQFGQEPLHEVRRRMDGRRTN